MPFRDLDTAAIARSLSQVADRQGDLADAYFERLEEVEVPAADESAGLRIRREEGFAIRLIREGRTWLASRDQIEPTAFTEAQREVTRVRPVASYSPPSLQVGPLDEPGVCPELQRFPLEVTQAIRRRLAGFPLRMTVRRHRRWLRVVGIQVAPAQEHEDYFSYEAETPWARHGALLSNLDETAVEATAASLTLLFRARDAAPPEPGRVAVVLGPAAAAVLLHEAVAHALETDTLVLGGRIEAALGVKVGSELLNVLDNPGGGPQGSRRETDDEGMRVIRRWLLRGGVVEQLLADLSTAHHSADLIAGAGRRSDRHMAPAPRSTHLELLAGSQSPAELISDLPQGLYFPEASRGSLDPMSGAFTLRLPGGRRIEGGAMTGIMAPCSIRGTVSDLLAAVTGVGDDCTPAGAGWCAKGGVRLPVWATTPTLRLEGVEVEP